MFYQLKDTVKHNTRTHSHMLATHSSIDVSLCVIDPLQVYQPFTTRLAHQGYFLVLRKGDFRSAEAFGLKLLSMVEALRMGATMVETNGLVASMVHHMLTISLMFTT